MSYEINHDIKISLNENQPPVVVPVKQFDYYYRRLRCALYEGSEEYTLDSDDTSLYLSLTGTRPDGGTFQYTSELSSNISVTSAGKILIKLTKFMTECYGLVPLDISYYTVSSNVSRILGTFSVILNIKPAGLYNGKGVYDYTEFLNNLLSGIIRVFVTADGYFGFESTDTGLSKNSDSDVLDKFYDEYDILTTSINEDGYITFTTEDDFGFTFDTDDYGRLLVNYN